MAIGSDQPSPVALAEQLLALVKSIHDADSTTASAIPGASSQAVHDAKNQVADTCDALMRSVLGPLEYTILLAGAWSITYKNFHARHSHTCTESCQESSALHFITSLGVADVIGDESVSLAELSKKLKVQARFLGKQRHPHYSRSFAPLRAVLFH